VGSRRPHRSCGTHRPSIDRARAAARRRAALASEFVPVILPPLDARFFGSARLFFSLLLTFSRSLVPSRRQKGEFDFWEWFNNAACRDSGVIGAGYEDALKNGQFKGKKKK
jgi:hypothetical protein|tara:strand:+ start:924 stop:1256 length:333 start_codon:yes stop_codon:yes gene_type:complete